MSERIVGPVAFDHRYAVLRISPLHQQAEIKPSRASTDTDYTHDPSLSANHAILQRRKLFSS
jgi:hypothetical protein